MLFVAEMQDCLLIQAESKGGLLEYGTNSTKKGALNFHSETIDPSSHEAPPCRFTYAGTCWWRVRYLRIDLIPTPKIQNDGTSDCCERCLFRLLLMVNSDWFSNPKIRKILSTRSGFSIPFLPLLLLVIFIIFEYSIIQCSRRKILPRRKLSLRRKKW